MEWKKTGILEKKNMYMYMGIVFIMIMICEKKGIGLLSI